MLKIDGMGYVLFLQVSRLYLKMPLKVSELKDILRAEKCDKNKKLYFDCEKIENTVRGSDSQSGSAVLDSLFSLRHRAGQFIFFRSSRSCGSLSRQSNPEHHARQ